MASAKVSHGDRVHHYLNEVESAINQCVNLVQRLMEISAHRMEEFSPDSLNRILCDMEPMLHCIMDEQITLTFVYGKDLPPIVGDPVQLQQAILNLALNAKQAMPQGGELRISTEYLQLTQFFGEVPPGEYAVLSVSDSGIGIDPKLHKRIFEPLFTTRGAEGGTGLGLSQVTETAQRHGGYVLVESTPGRGSRFSVLLPLAIGQDGTYTQPAKGTKTLF
jgi:signal transduction histidine kinase